MIDLSQDACDTRLLNELIFITQLAETCWSQDVWGVTEIDRAHFYPDQWTPCGTRGCLAGWAAVHAGLAQPALQPIELEEFGDTPKYYLEITDTGAEMIHAAELTPDPREVPLYDIRQDFHALGLVLFGLESRFAAISLFRSNHTLGSLWTSAYALTLGRIVLPRELEERVYLVDTSRYERFRR